MSSFGSKWLFRIFRGHFLGYKSMEKVHALGSAVLAVADVGYGLLFSPCVNVNETLECAVCYGS
jgi:hypothetical protein